MVRVEILILVPEDKEVLLKAAVFPVGALDLRWIPKQFWVKKFKGPLCQDSKVLDPEA
jgi:hypothetical protein